MWILEAVESKSWLGLLGPQAVHESLEVLLLEFSSLIHYSLPTRAVHFLRFQWFATWNSNWKTHWCTKDLCWQTRFRYVAFLCPFTTNNNALLQSQRKQWQNFVCILKRHATSSSPACKICITPWRILCVALDNSLLYFLPNFHVSVPFFFPAPCGKRVSPRWWRTFLAKE